MIKLPVKYLENCIKLNHLGLYEVAFRKDDAFAVLEYSKQSKLAVLGLDVLDNRTGVYSHNYDNWYPNIHSDNWDEYVTESVNKANAYIKDYLNKDATFVLTLSDKENSRF